MRIEYLGHSCFKITDSNGISVVTDPYQGVGYSLPEKVSADIVTVSHSHFDHNYTEAIKGNPQIVTACQKRTINGVTIEGIASYHDEQKGRLRGENRIFKIRMDGMTLCHLGDLGEPVRLELVKAIGETDILFIPIGGTYTIDATQAKSYVNAIAPKMVIPMHYKPKDGTLDITDETPFLRLFERVTYANGSVLKLDGFTDENIQIVFMERGNEKV